MSRSKLINEIISIAINVLSQGSLDTNNNYDRDYPELKLRQLTLSKQNFTNRTSQIELVVLELTRYMLDSSSTVVGKHFKRSFKLNLEK